MALFFEKREVKTVEKERGKIDQHFEKNHSSSRPKTQSAVTLLCLLAIIPHTPFSYGIGSR
jgi:hypothetical protein